MRSYYLCRRFTTRGFVRRRERANNRGEWHAGEGEALSPKIARFDKTSWPTQAIISASYLSQVTLTDDCLLVKPLSRRWTSRSGCSAELDSFTVT